jgi:hypothetical protein
MKVKNVFKFDQPVSFERIQGLCDICTIDGSIISSIKIDYDIRRPYIKTILTVWTTKKRRSAVKAALAKLKGVAE